jgi:hypothetical protein
MPALIRRASPLRRGWRSRRPQKQNLCFWPPPQDSYESYGCLRPTHERPPATWLEELDREQGMVLLPSERVFTGIHSPSLNNSHLFTADP